MTTNRADISRRPVFFHGQPAPGALLKFYNAGTSTPITVYQDSAATTPHTWPVVADAYGAAPAIYVPFGSYRLQTLTAGGVVIFDDDDIPNVDPASGSGGGGGGGVEGYAVGDFKLTGLNLTPTGWTPSNGNTVGSASSGANGRANSDCENLFLHIWDNYPAMRALVSTGPGSTAAADWAANKTIPTPNFQGAALTGITGMGAVSVTNPFPSGLITDPSQPGQRFGAATHTLSVAELAAHNHGGATGAADPLEVYPVFSSVLLGTGAPAANFTLAVTTDNRSISHVHSIASQGGGAAHNNTQVSVGVYVYMKL